MFRALFEETVSHGSCFDTVHFSISVQCPKAHLFLLIHHPQTTSTFCHVHPSPPLPEPTLNLQDHVCLFSPAPWFPALRLLLATVSHLFPDYRVWFVKQLGPFLAVCKFFFKAKDFLGCPVSSRFGSGEWSVGTVLSNLYMY